MDENPLFTIQHTKRANADAITIKTTFYINLHKEKLTAFIIY